MQKIFKKNALLMKKMSFKNYQMKVNQTILNIKMILIILYLKDNNKIMNLHINLKNILTLLIFFKKTI